MRMQICSISLLSSQSIPYFNDQQQLMIDLKIKFKTIILWKVILYLQIYTNEVACAFVSKSRKQYRTWGNNVGGDDQSYENR